MLGELAALSAAACWAVASLLFAHLGRTAKLAPRTLNLFKCSVALLLLWLTLAVSQGRLWPQVTHSWQLVALALSGLIGLTLGDTAYFNGLIRLGPRRALLFSTLGPPITALLAWPLLAEPLTGPMLLGMALTLGGIVWVIRERTAPPTEASDEEHQRLRREERVGILFAIASVACQAMGNVLTKLGAQDLLPLETSILRLLFGSIGLWLWVVLSGSTRKLALEVFAERRRLALLTFASVLGTYLGIWLLVTGLQYAEKAGVAATLSAMSPVFVLPLAAIFLKERISLRAVFGALLAIAGVALLVWGKG